MLGLAIYILDTCKHVPLQKVSEDPDKMPHKALLYQGMHCLLR